jgi:hypothetical protein
MARFECTIARHHENYMPILKPHDNAENAQWAVNTVQRRLWNRKETFMGLARDHYLRIGYLMPV